jgi:hypothetical protein
MTHRAFHVRHALDVSRESVASREPDALRVMRGRVERGFVARHHGFSFREELHLVRLFLHLGEAAHLLRHESEDQCFVHLHLLG